MILKLIDVSWYQQIDYSYYFNPKDLVFIIFLSFLISFILHKFYNKTDFEISNDNQIEVIEVRQYSFTTKVLVVFFIMVLISMPIFKLLKTGYFL